MHRISKQGSERATSGGGGKIVTKDGQTHVVWQDSTEDGYPNMVGTYDHDAGEMTTQYLLNYGEDNHARPNIIMDHAGYLHAIISGHNSPVTHRRSIKPNDASAWTEPEIIGEGTYPIPACEPDGTLYVAMRSANRWNGVDLHVKPPNESWEKRNKLVHRDPDLNGYAAFHSGLAVAPDGTLHTVIDFYEGEGIYDRRGLHQAVAYMESSDGGRTWTKADGTPIELSARPPEMDVIVRDVAEERHEDKPPPLILSHGSLVLDEKNRPHILYIDHRRGPGQVMHAWADAEGDWTREPIRALNSAFPEHRPTGCRGSFGVRGDGTMFALLELVPLGEGWENGLPTRAMGFDGNLSKCLVWLMGRDDERRWSAAKAMKGDDFNEPNVERAVGGSQMPEDTMPPFIYFDGTSRYPEEDEIIQNNVYLVCPKSGISPDDTFEGTEGAGLAPYHSADNWRETVPEKFIDRSAFAYPGCDPDLPNVLLLGDSISMSYTADARRHLSGKANVYRAPANCRSVRQIFEKIETYLGRKKWDVIHFNCGIHDITLVDGHGELSGGGEAQVPLDEYRLKLERLVRRLNATGAELIWATTTPVAEDVEVRRIKDVKTYNRAARKIMKRHLVAINDLHQVVEDSGESLWADGVHFNKTGVKLLAESVVTSIKERL